jgi:dimethylargininase
VSPSLARCELTHLAREPIDVAQAVSQHAAYERLCASLGATIVRVAAASECPDAVFVEDTAIVLDEVAVLTRPGAPARRGEVTAVGPVLARYRPVRPMSEPATLDGGDVLRLGRTLYVGRSSRTSQEGITQLGRLLAPFDYCVIAVEFNGCLHLKSAVTDVADGLLLLNPAWVSDRTFPGWEAMTIDAGEPFGANALRLGGAVVFPAQFPRTLGRLAERGLRVEPVDCSELAKAEGAVTCCSLLVPVTP